MQVVLSMFRSDGDRRSFSLHKDLTIIGRREDCDLRIPLGEISRKHCRLIKDGDALKLEDLGSSNGTYHNGQRVQEALIQPGDTIQVGSIAFVVQIDGVPADEEMQPVLAGAPGADDDTGAPMAAAAAEVDQNGTGGGEVVVQNDAGHAEGDFDPMAILENTDSHVDSNALAIDLEQSHHGQNAGA
jgi:pSer/pThr/pTyr-binding forkhead associated (FHA) protein